MGTESLRTGASLQIEIPLQPALLLPRVCKSHAIELYVKMEIGNRFFML